MCEFLCAKDWSLNGIVHFFNGQCYNAKKLDHAKDGSVLGVYVVGENGINAWFYKGSEYFDIQ